MDNNFFIQAIIYLAAAVIFVPIAKKIGLSSILGYLFAGIIIGPFVLGLIGQRGEDIMHFAEFGVVMMLFLIGLELDPYKFWKMRKFILGMGSIQVFGTTFLITLATYSLFGWTWQTALAVGLALSLSSTAIVLQTLKEKGLSNTSMGRASFAVLLFQDISVIPILAFIPLLASADLAENLITNKSFISEFAGWLKTLIVFATIGLVYVSGKFLVVPFLHMIAKTRLQELFTATALLLVLGVSYLMQLVGLSPALGAFMAGVVLANSEFKHELEGDIAPFKGLLLGLFFIGVGASINFDLIIENPVFILVSVLVLTLIKFLVLFGVGKLYKKSNDQNLLFSIGLSQAGEFGFVILSFGMQISIVQTTIANQTLAVIALSMLLTPFLLLINEKWIDPNFGVKETVDDKVTPIDDHKEVIIAGFGHFGSTIGRLLRANGVNATILDHDSERVDMLRKIGFKVYYGDATRKELLEAAGIANAKLFIAAIDNPTVNLTMVELIRKNYPHLKILSRARNRVDAFELLEHGVNQFYRETLYTAVHLGVDALVEMGHRKYSATRQGQRFIKYDDETTRRIASKRHDKMAFLATMKDELEMQEELLKNDLQTNFKASDHAWDSSVLKENNTSKL
jgi:CPA2 family monovalent cation:H+ antiporter-2